MNRITRRSPERWEHGMGVVAGGGEEDPCGDDVAPKVLRF